MLSRKTLIGPWAGIPVAWTDTEEFDQETYCSDVLRCCRAGAPGVYTGGTTGEFYALEFEEFQAISRATVETCRACDKPAMIGCTSTSTRGTIRRAIFAAEIGADAVQVALPYWLPLHDEEVLPFFRELFHAIPDTPISIYETRRAKKCLTLEQHQAILDLGGRYLMVKANVGTLGDSPDGCRQLSQHVNVFVGEPRWAELGPSGAIGCCSAMIYWNPNVLLQAWEQMRNRDWSGLELAMRRICQFYDFLHATFEPYGLSDTAYDRLVGRATGFLRTSLTNRGPYRSATPEQVSIVRNWLAEWFPEMLHHPGT